MRLGLNLEECTLYRLKGEGREFGGLEGRKPFQASKEMMLVVCLELRRELICNIQIGQRGYICLSKQALSA